MLTTSLHRGLLIAGLGVLFSFQGCSCQAEFGTPPKTPEPAPPSTVRAVPAPAPEPSPPAPEPPKPAPSADPPVIKPIGKAVIEGDQIKIPGKIEFDVDKATIRNDPGSQDVIKQLADVLKANPNVSKVRIEGHTDNSGTPERNRSLSAERAQVVAEYLAAQGIDKKRLDTAGFGSDRPLVPNDTPEHKQLNRRTEFHIVELNGKPVDPSRFLAPRPPAATGAVPVDGGAPAASVPGTDGGTMNAATADGGAGPKTAASVPSVPVPPATASVKPGDLVISAPPQVRTK